MELKILIRTDEGKQQQFTLRGVVLNPEIPLGSVAFYIEKAINDHTRYRAHTDIVPASEEEDKNQKYLDSLYPVDPRD
jgi:hypothetical protein